MALSHRRTRHFLTQCLRSPQRLLNAVLMFLAYRLRWRQVPAQPVMVDIEPTNACNFRCPHCHVTHADWARHTLSGADATSRRRLCRCER